MGLFDDAVNFLKKQLGGGEEQGGLLEQALGLVNNPDTGGLAGLVQRLQAGGLGQEVSSWISTGENLPVSAEQLQQALGGRTIEDVAAQLGLSREEAAQKLSGLLPQIIDKLTPEGALPEGGLLEKGFTLLKGKLGM
jgi:uncharacterized protein YidB (DUF937 family)